MEKVYVKDLAEKFDVGFGTSGIRALVNGLTPSVCFSLVTGFLQNICPSTKKVAIAIDLRPSSPEIAKACIFAIETFGAKVEYCGELPTPALAFYSIQNSIPAIMITGSHIPFDRNGMKFYTAAGEITKFDECAIMDSNVCIPNRVEEQLKEKTLPKVCLNASKLYKKRYQSFFNPEMLKGMRVGVYEHSSVARDIIKELLQYFKADVVSLERTDTFVPIDTEAVTEEDKIKALNWVKKYKLDAIVSTDGDGDRPLISDEKGQWFRGDIVGLLCANYLNATHIVAPINVNTVLELESAKKSEEILCVRTRIGSPYVIEGMNKIITENSIVNVVGYEANGGFLVGSNIKSEDETLFALPTRDSILPILLTLATSFKSKLPLSKVTEDFESRFTASDRIKNISINFTNKLLLDLNANKYNRNQLLFLLRELDIGDELDFDCTDGVRLTLNNAEILHLRLSGNAPELRCYVETESQERSDFLVKSILEILKIEEVKYTE